MPTAEKILELARGELGEREFPPGSNNVKYNTAYYGGAVSGSNLDWCLVFIWWLFREAGASALFYDGGKTAYVPTFLAWAKGKGLLAGEPRAGDLVCFDFNSNVTPDHIGVCESFDGAYVTTIDGNTGTGSEANGGAVMRRRRHKRYITAVIRPRYEEETMSQEQFDHMLENWLERQAAAEPSGWSAQFRAWAEQAGIISGYADGSRQYQRFATREELATMLYKFAQWLRGQ